MKKKIIDIKHGALAVYERGAGSPYIFLHGGPGDTHHYMARMAKPIEASARCIFYDQRGTGASQLDRLDADTLSLENFFDDLLKIKKSLSLEKLNLVGHSWGAILAFYFHLAHPDLVQKSLLVSIGPLDAEDERNSAKRFEHYFTPEEWRNWLGWRSERNEALAAGDSNAVLIWDRKMMELRAKAWVFDPDKRAAFLAEYYQDPPPNRRVNKLVWAGAQGFFSHEKFCRLNQRMLFCSGDDDFMPSIFNEKEFQKNPNIQIKILPRCGHMPWIDRAQDFYSILRDFLQE